MSLTSSFATPVLLLVCVVLFSVTDAEECEGEVGQFGLHCAWAPEFKNSPLNHAALFCTSAWMFSHGEYIRYPPYEVNIEEVSLLDRKLKTHIIVTLNMEYVL